MNANSRPWIEGDQKHTTVLVHAVSGAHMRKESKLSFHSRLWGASDNFGADGRNVTRRTVVRPEVVFRAWYSRESGRGRDGDGWQQLMRVVNGAES